MTGEEQRDSAGATPPAPIWHLAVYRLQPGTITIESKLKTTPEQFWDEVTDAYRGDHLLILTGSTPQAAFPARQLLTVELRPCQPYEIPEDDR